MIISAWINGVFCSPSDALIPASDLGFLRGYSVFDYLRTHNGKPFHAADYIDRLFASAKALHLHCPLTKREIIAVMKELIERSRVEDTLGIRMVLTGGTSTDGMRPSSPNLVITAERFSLPSASQLERGVELASCEFMRELPQVKTTNYINAIRIRGQHPGIYDLLYHYKGRLLETSRNNFFIFSEGELITPAENVLMGVSRKIVIALAREAGYNVIERDVLNDELGKASEAFVTGTTKGTIPVVRVDGTVIGSGRPGEETRKLMKLLNNYKSNY